MRLDVSLVLLLAATASARSRVTVNTGYSREEYSFTSAGWQQWTAVAADGPVPQSRVLAGQSVVRRFGFNDLQGTLGAAAKLGKSIGLEAKISIAPDAKVLPHFLTDWTLYRGLRSGLSLSPAYRYSHYPSADVHMLAFGSEWEKNAALTLISRFYLTLTQFVGGGAERMTPAVLASAKLSPASSLLMSPSYAYRKESFQAGAPGSFASGVFSAHTLRLELRWIFRKDCFASGAWSYESRIPAAIMRQYELGLGAGF